MPNNGMIEVNMLLPEAINSWFHMAFLTAVPLLSVISGFLFFNGNKFNYSVVIKKKLKTIMLPAWTWCLMWLTFAAVVFYASNGKYYSGGNYNFNEFNLIMGLNGIFGLTDYPFATQFWFVHDLILTFLIFPLIKYCLDRRPYSFLAALFILWFSKIGLIFFFKVDVLLFFVVGGVIAKYDSLHIFKKVNKPIVRIFVPLFYLIILTLRAWTYLFFDNESIIAEHIQSGSTLKFLRIFGVVAFSVWIFWAQKNLQFLFSFLVKFSSYAFIVHAMHYPLIDIISSIYKNVFNLESTNSMLFAWIMIPSATIFLCLTIPIIAGKILPKITNFLAGQRLA